MKLAPNERYFYGRRENISDLQMQRIFRCQKHKNVLFSKIRLPQPFLVRMCRLEIEKHLQSITFRLTKVLFEMVASMQRTEHLQFIMCKMTLKLFF